MKAWITAGVLLGFVHACASSPCDLRDELIAKAGSSATDCGRVTLEASSSAVDACVMKAFGNHAAFFARYEQRGTDSQVVFGIAGDKSDIVFFHWDGDPSGGSGADPVINAERCIGPAVLDTPRATEFGAMPPIACDSVEPLGVTCR